MGWLSSAADSSISHAQNGPARPQSNRASEDWQMLGFARFFGGDRIDLEDRPKNGPVYS
jgi:hypothetical protein